MNYEWDTNKAADNVAKHGVTFEEAATVFDDPLAAFFDDVLHSDDEIRYLSARLATKREREKHERETIG